MAHPAHRTSAWHGTGWLIAACGVVVGCGDPSGSAARDPTAFPSGRQAILPADKVAPQALQKLDEYGRKVVALGGRPQIHLDFSYANITDNDLITLEVLPIVTSIDLSHSKISDAAIAHLIQYPQLEKVTLIGVPITDKSVEYFKQMPKLWYVHMNQVKLSREAQLELTRFLAPRAQAETRARDRRISTGPGGPR